MLLGLPLNWYSGDGDDNDINNDAVIGTVIIMMCCDWHSDNINNDAVTGTVL